MVEMGEYVVGAYLKLIEGCDLISYDVAIGNQGEVDVVGVDFVGKKIYLCEVATHLLGLNYGRGSGEIVPRTKKKFERVFQFKEKIAKSLPDFNFVFMFWSPIVAKNVFNDLNTSLPELELIVNQPYTIKINELKQKAKETKSISGEPFFRALQILAHMK